MRKENPILPPTYLLMALLLIIILNFTIPIIKIIPVPWNIIGLLPVMLGLWISIGADAQFKKRETTIKPFEKPSALVIDGWFKISRNPMYLGFVLVLVGISILLGSLTPFLVMVVFSIIMQLKFIRFEEQMMTETFGEEWEKYVQNVRRWI